MSLVEPSLKITEIFYSLQGESSTVGLPTVFVRLTGCPLRCNYCDTAYAFSGGERMTLTAIVDRVAGFAPRYVTVSGGEPLAQTACWPLLTQLCDQGYQVSLETSGAMSIEKIDPRVMVVMDLKTPSSTEQSKNHYANVNFLKPADQVKFVLANREDYLWACEQMASHQLAERCHVLMSPSHGVLANQTLADWIVEDNLPVRFQVQLHKYIWQEEMGR